MRVLVVEDQKGLAATIALGVRREAWRSTSCSTAQALERARSGSPDVLDHDLATIHGDEVCRMLVWHGSRSRVLMLTAADSIEHRVEELGLRADDYLLKPFAFAKLVARVRPLARRIKTALKPILKRGRNFLDTGERLATRAGRRLELSPNERVVLEPLLAADGNSVSAEHLLERASGECLHSLSNVVKATASRLRRKLGDPVSVETVPGGYRIVP